MTPPNDIASMFQLAARSHDFRVGQDDFQQLVVRPVDDGPLHYFWLTSADRLIKHFVLREGPRVHTVCNVTLVQTAGGLSPRLRLWKRDMTKGAAAAAAKNPVPSGELVLVKAAVDTDDCHEELWTLINFLRSFAGVEVPGEVFHVVGSDDASIVASFKGHEKADVLRAVRSHFEGGLSEADVAMLVDRKTSLQVFESMVDDREFFDRERERRQKSRDEDVWQAFFEENRWIFGYGLSLVACESAAGGSLEQRTTGANLFGGAGKRSDGVLKTMGFIKSLLFVEIKNPATRLLRESAYRPPDVYNVSAELSGAVAQVRKTAHKAVKTISDLHRLSAPDGEFQFELSTIEPRQAVVIGDLRQLADGGAVNGEKLSSFELFRRSQAGVEILTFDELLERARFIVDS